MVKVNKMEYYYKNNMTEKQFQIGGIRKSLVYKKRTVDFIKNYCSDYLSLGMNIITVMVMVF